MHLLQRFAWVLVAGISLLVALFGLFRFLIEVGESPLHYVVSDAALFAVGVIGMMVCWRRGNQLKAAHQAELDEKRRFIGRELEASARPVKQALALAVFVAMAAVCTMMLLEQPGDVLLIGLSVALWLFVALMVPMVLSFYRRGRPALRLDGRGVDHVWFGEVPWSDVHGIFHKQYTVKQSTVHSLLLGVSQPGRYLARMPWIARVMTGKWSPPRGRFGVLEIPLNPLDKDPLLVVNAAQALRDQVSPPRLGHWHPAQDDESIAIWLETEYLASNPDRLPEHELLPRLEALNLRLQAVTDRMTARR